MQLKTAHLLGCNICACFINPVGVQSLTALHSVSCSVVLQSEGSAPHNKCWWDEVQRVSVAGGRQPPALRMTLFGPNIVHKKHNKYYLPHKPALRPTDPLGKEKDELIHVVSITITVSESERRHLFQREISFGQQLQPSKKATKQFQRQICTK